MKTINYNVLQSNELFSFFLSFFKDSWSCNANRNLAELSYYKVDAGRFRKKNVKSYSMDVAFVSKKNRYNFVRKSMRKLTLQI